jgi:serine/threonine protein kinase
MTASTKHKPGSREVNVRCAKELMDCMRSKGYGPEDIFFKHNCTGDILADKLNGVQTHRPESFHESAIEPEFKKLLRLHRIAPKNTVYPIAAVLYNGVFSGYVMERIYGAELTDYGPLQCATKLNILNILGQYYDTLERYHENGEAHGDPNKSNIMIISTSKGPLVVMIDPAESIIYPGLEKKICHDAKVMRNVRHAVELRYGIRPGELELFRRSARGQFRLAEPRFESGP